jgi:hypothetical protein
LFSLSILFYLYPLLHFTIIQIISFTIIFSSCSFFVIAPYLSLELTFTRIRHKWFYVLYGLVCFILLITIEMIGDFILLEKMIILTKKHYVIASFCSFIASCGCLWIWIKFILSKINPNPS